MAEYPAAYIQSIAIKGDMDTYREKFARSAEHAEARGVTLVDPFATTEGANLLRELHAVRDRHAEAVSTVKDFEDQRDQIIRDALAAGVPALAVARHADVSRARVYQIRDGRR